MKGYSRKTRRNLNRHGRDCEKNTKFLLGYRISQPVLEKNAS